MKDYPRSVQRASRAAPPRRRRIICLFAFGAAIGCSAASPGLGRQPAVPGDRPIPIAIVNGAPIAWDDVRAALAEAAGGIVLEELTLDRLLARELSERGLTLEPEDTARERRRLVDSLARDAAASPDDSERLLEALRRARGLGEARFAALLRRNASLRRILESDPEAGARARPSEEDIAQAYQVRHGPRLRASVIAVASEQEAGRIRASLREGEGDLAARFAAEATRVSIDPTGPRGGAMEPVSPADPALPLAVRNALAALEVNTLSPVIPVEGGFAVLLLHERTQPDGPTLEEAHDAIASEVRQRLERVAMEQIARNLLRTAEVTPIDRALAWGWEARGATTQRTP